MLRIARRELLLQYREGRLLLGGGILLLLMLAAAVSGWAQYEQATEAGAGFMQQAREQWLNQGERHPHRAAHFGVYVVKPETSLAFFEPGLRPFVGQTLWLEAHDRPAFTNIPSEDDLTLGVGFGVASGGTILQMLGSLLVLSVGALAVARERESGVLRQVLAQGVSPWQWTAGKFLGLAAATILPLLLLGLAVTVAAVWLAQEGQRMDTLLRALMMVAGNALLLGALLALGLGVSVRARSTRTALLVVLGFWLFGCVLGPRLASTLSTTLAPAPTLSSYRGAVAKAFDEGFDERGGYMDQLETLEDATIEQYGVDALAELPVGFSGLRMKHMDGWTAEVDDREYRKLEAVYERQQGIRLALSALAPFIAARQVSQGMAGMDWAHYRHFLLAAETYRRGFGEEMNTLLEQSVTGERWETDGDFTDWAAVAPFDYELPRVDWALSQQQGFVLVLGLWAVAAGLALYLASRRMAP